LGDFRWKLFFLLADIEPAFEIGIDQAAADNNQDQIKKSHEYKIVDVPGPFK
jgi:hypothetical protein